MACSSCRSARVAAAQTLKAGARGNLKQAVASAREAIDHVVEAHRIRAITRKKPRG